MATQARAQTGQPIAVGSGDQIATLQNLLSTLFGQSQTTSNTANIAPLQQVLAQMQAQGGNYQQLLQSIFAQAGGAIPGIQAAYGNAVGARSGGNSAVQANLERLMQQTALLGQQQVVQQQQQNNQTMTQAAGGIANATQQTTTSTPGRAKDLAGLLAVTQAALKLSGSNNLEELYKKVSGTGKGAASAAGATATTGAAMPMQNGQTMGAVPAGMVMSAAAPQMSIAPFVPQTGVNDLLSLASQGGYTSISGENSAPFGGINPWEYDLFPTGGMSYAPDMAPFQPIAPVQDFTPAPAGFFPEFDLMSYF